ncbi:MAG: DUF3817 domain-containing protein [Actinomycetota bacterium]|nr:DUF3817 domain-containing protein [Actinomycetota bacterium]
MLTLYRVLATVVGISIATLVLVGVPLKYAHNLWPSVLPPSSLGWRVGTNINLYLGTAHGFIYLGFLLVALSLALRARWSTVFTVLTLVCGTIPIVSFWAEFRAIRKVEREFPDEVGFARSHERTEV